MQNIKFLPQLDEEDHTFPLLKLWKYQVLLIWRLLPNIGYEPKRPLMDPQLRDFLDPDRMIEDQAGPTPTMAPTSLAPQENVTAVPPLFQEQVQNLHE